MQFKITGDEEIFQVWSKKKKNLATSKTSGIRPVPDFSIVKLRKEPMEQKILAKLFSIQKFILLNITY